MKVGNVILVLILIFGAFGGGIFFERHHTGIKPINQPSLSDANSSKEFSLMHHPRLSFPATDPEAKIQASNSLSEIEAALKEALRTDMSRRYEVLADLVRGLNPSILPQVATLVAKVAPPADKGNLRGMLLARWAQTDAVAAMAYAQKVQGAQNRNQAISSVLQGWSEGAAKENALGSIAYQWVATDPKAALAYVQNLPNGETRNRFLANLAGQYADQDPQAALAWIQQLPADRGRTEILQGIASRLAWSE